MSAKDDKSSNNDEESGINQDAANHNTGLSVGIVTSLDTNKNADVIGAISENIPQLATTDSLDGNNKDAGDKNTNLEECDSITAKQIEELRNIDSGKGSGDFVTTYDNDKVEKSDDNDRTDLNTDIVNEDEIIDNALNKNDKTKNDDDSDINDDDMELRWDDDEGTDQLLTDNDDKFDSANDMLSEEQLLEENDEETATSEVDSAANPAKESKDIKETEDLLEESNNDNDTHLGTISMGVTEKALSDKVKEVTASEIEISVDLPSDGKASDIIPESDTLQSKSVDSNKEGNCKEIKMIVPSQSKPETEIAESNEDEILENKQFLESANNRLNSSVLMDTVESKEMEESVLENELLEDAETIEPLTTNVCTEDNQDVSEETLSEEKLLEETKLAETEVSKIDITMEKVDNENENELLGSESNQDVLPMDVDNVDSIDGTNFEEDSKPSNETKNTEVKESPLEIETHIKSNLPKNRLQLSETINLEIVSEIPEDGSEIDKIVLKKNKKQVTDGDIVEKNDEIMQSEPEKLLTEDTDSEIQETKEISVPLKDSKAGNEELVDSNISKPDDIIIEKSNSTKPTFEKSPVADSNTPQTISIPEVEFRTPTCSQTSEDSPIHIKTDHSLHKPDAMLEIPSQELFDIDEADLSMNADQSIDGSMVDIVKETAADKGVFEKSLSEIIDKIVEKDLGKEIIEEGTEKLIVKEVTAANVDECIASTSQVKPSTSFNKMTPDTADEVPEISDSLGLLAESTGRVMDDDEPDDDDDADADDDDDFDQDESSNQISAEQSEDSNAPHSETEPARDQDEKDIETPENKEEAFQFDIDSAAQDEEKMDVDVESEKMDKPDAMDDETQTAIDALMKADDIILAPVDNKEPTVQICTDAVKLSETCDNKIEDKTQPEAEQEIAAQEKPIESPTDSPTKESSNQSASKSPDQSPKKSPSKIKNLAITTLQATDVVNIVDLEESSSSEDDIQEVKKLKPEAPEVPEVSEVSDDTEVTKVNIPTGIEIMCTGSTTSEIVTKEGEVVIKGIPKPPPQKPARLNTSEVSIKTVSTAEPIVIPETKINESTQSDAQTKPKLSLEIFSLDSDEEDSAAKEKPAHTSPHKMTALELEKARETSKCINYCCTSDSKEVYRVADATTVAYYDAGRKRRAMVCQKCADVVANRTKNLIEGIKDMTPLLQLEMSKLSQDLVEISDSESEDEDNTPDEPKESIGEKGAKFLEENLTQLLNETWMKYDMDTRLKETQIMLEDDIEKLEQESKEIDEMLNECQIATDKLRNDLYATFECRRQELNALCIVDTPDHKYVGFDKSNTSTTDSDTRQAKRRLSSATEQPPKRPAIPLGYTPLDADASQNKATEPKPATNQQPVVDSKLEDKMDDDKDISVVKLSAESAPADLPPPGEISRPPLRVGMAVYAMKNAFGPWLKGKVLEIQAKNIAAGNPFALCRVKFDHKAKHNGKVLAARCIAYAEPADVRMTIGTRLIALFKDSNKRESYYSGVVAEIPNPVNNYRYLVFFDDGYAQYVQHAYTRLVCESSHLVWEEVHPFSREFVREYLMAYPERPMVRLHEGQHLKTEWNGKWWPSKVIRVDASLAQVMFVGDGRREWIYRGSTRLAPLYLELRAAERHRPRPMPRSKAQPRFNMPYVEYTRSDEQENKAPQETETLQQQNEEIRRQRAVAKKSTSVPAPAPAPLPPAASILDTVTSRVVYYTPKNAVKPFKMAPHRCGPKCKRSDVLSLKELRTYNPLAKPLLSGWERQIVRYKGHKEIMYRAPCGRRVRNMRELHHYLRAVDSDLPVDLFDFHPATHCLAEFVLNKCLVGKKDLSHGIENVPVPCVNYYDDSLPEFCSYNTERTPTAGVPLNLDPEFLCGCDCTDDCQDKSKCACWKMTLEGARTIGLNTPNVGYVYKRLPEPLPSGIYECNSRCKCKHTCLNRVAQHPLQLKLQVFKTPNRGWGIRALNDVPKGSFLCVYVGNLLTDATANLDGLNEGDEYLAELDYIEVVEQMKEGYEEDIPEGDKKLDKKDKVKEEDDDDDEDDEPSSDDDNSSKTDRQDDDFRPGHIGLGVAEFSKRLRRREKKKDKEAAQQQKDKDSKQTENKEKDSKEAKDSNAEEDCITISDDEEVREPSRFTVQAGMGASEFISKYKSVRTLFGQDEACYIMDAKVQGNIGRYLNHSCCPNVFVQNVFVDTHDPRFPWVAFFALSHIKAGTELTWNYNYDVGSVPGKILYCYCGAPNCRGRLL